MGCLFHVLILYVNCLQDYFRVTGHWMATATNLPQGNAEEDPCRHSSRVLPQGREALNHSGGSCWKYQGDISRREQIKANQAVICVMFENIPRSADVVVAVFIQ